MDRKVTKLPKLSLFRYPQHPLSSRIQQYIDRLLQSRAEVYEDINRKRALSTDVSNTPDAIKRAKIGNMSNTPSFPVAPLPPGPASFAQLYTLTSDAALTSFDVAQLPAQMVIQITLPVLARIDQSLLEGAVTVGHSN